MNQLKISQIKGGTWIDAGCGYGTYTLPLATLVSRVIAIDADIHKIEYLRARLPHESNVECYHRDFNVGKLFDELVDGILFGYSLHYQPDQISAIRNAYKQINYKGAIVIIDYDRDRALPWVPYPFPQRKALQLLKEIGFKNIETILQDGRIYILRGKK